MRSPVFLKPIVLAALAALMSACGGLPKNVEKTPSTAFMAPSSTSVGKIFEDEAKRHPGKSGFALIPAGRGAFTDRVALAEFAEKSLDVQYYIWSTDTIGSLLAERIIAAAERGVRVRFLLDDMVFLDRDSAAASLGAHPNIEVRIFNPAVFRNARMLNMMTNFGRLNHRMHNKILVMDNAVAIVGGRNIADEYFGLSGKYNNRDFDIAAAGPIVREISATFDEFWNSEASIPIEALVREERTMEDFELQLAVLRSRIKMEDYPWPLEADIAELRSQLHAINRDLVWAPGQVIYDSIGGLTGEGEERLTVIDWMDRKVAGLEKEFLIESAYFVTRKPGLEIAKGLNDRGVKVRVLTNSLASNNVPAAQAGHAAHRKRLLEAGVEIYEMRPDAAWVRRDAAKKGQDAITTLHTKVVVFDRKSAFVGSYNLDPRSADINTEIGLHVESPEFAREVAEFLDGGVAPENAYRVTLDAKGNVVWSTVVDGKTVTWNVDPETTGGQRFSEGLIKMLPIKSQL